jgi:predicted acylesterase/phospholipase RssA
MTAKIGFVFSGAGARIAQEAALTRTLVQGLTPSRREIIPDVVAGASAGSLNAVMLNAILDPGNNLGWDFYTKEFLFALRNKSVYRFNGLSLLTEGALFDTSPLEELLKEFLYRRMGYAVLGDLPISTYISVVRRESGKELRLHSHSPKHASYPLVDVIMASCAIPAVFPTRRIKGLVGEFLDGATGRDCIPVEALSSEEASEIYVISRMRSEYGNKRDVGLETETRPKIVEVAENAMLAFDYMSDALFHCELDRAVDIAEKCKGRAFLYLPRLSKDYPSLDFNTQEEQYKKTMAWAKRNDPEELTEETVKWWKLRWLRRHGKS